MKIKLCIDSIPYRSKPEKEDAMRLSATIAGNVREVTLEELGGFIDNGQTICPTVFRDHRKSGDYFEEQQIFALDFDGNLSLTDALTRCATYHVLPTLYYETFSSNNYSRFRFLFCHCTRISSAEVARTIQLSLLSIFTEADQTSKDITKMYYGGKNTRITGNSFDAHTLLLNVINCFNDHDENDHLQRKLRKFTRSSGLVLENGVFKTELTAADNPGTIALPPNNKIGGINAYTITIYMDSAFKTPFFMTFYFTGKTNKFEGESTVPATSAAPQGQKKKLVRDVDYQKLTQRCPLFQALTSGDRWLEHSELFGLITNFIHLQGGQYELLMAAGMHLEYYEQKLPEIRRALDYASRNGYHPMRCECFCPYANKCNHHATLIETIRPPQNSITRVTNLDPDLVRLEESYQEFQDKFHEIMSGSGRGIHVIRAQTGIGKTHTYLEYLKSCQTPCIIAVPTNKLKEAVFLKAVAMGIDAMMTPSIEEIKTQLPNTQEKLDHLYAIGNEEAVNGYLRDYGRNNDAACIDKYFQALEKTYRSGEHIITTHAKLLHMKEEFLRGYTVIIDEDIMSNLFRVESVAISSVRNFLNACHPSVKVQRRLEHVLAICSQSDCYFQNASLSFSMQERLDFFSKIEKLKLWISSNILGLCESGALFFCEKTQHIHYLRTQKLVEGVCYVILSATADRMIYEKVFGIKNIVFYQCKEAKYKGKVIQFHDKTYSRFCVKQVPDFYDELRLKHEGCPIITFKDDDDLAGEEVLHFGATEGHNDYEGMDIVVAGTPHKPEYVSRLLGLQLGIDVTDTLSPREIERNGYRFRFMTYANPELRAIQLWGIESTIEQCIGRARLLRHPSTVYLYSNFPVKQCCLDSENR
jgi:hypothetical protein